MAQNISGAADLNGETMVSSNGLVNGHMNGSPTLTKTYLDGKAVRTVYGLVPLKYALDWPVFASYDELAGCANWMGGRIPTVEEARSIYSYVDGLKLKEAEQHLAKPVPAVNGYVLKVELFLCGANLLQTPSQQWSGRKPSFMPFNEL